MSRSNTSFKVADSLYLVRQTLSKGSAPAKPVEVPTDHIAVLDCSGSMAYDLPKVRQQLKQKLPKLLKPKDTISLVWFSGRGQCDVLLEAEPVATLADLKDVNTAIDRWIKPVGMTGFKEPIELVSKLTERLAKKSKNVCALIFMSDGCDNQWPRGDILKAVEKAAGGLASATFVEYGYYADRPLLTAMAEKSGGSLIFAEDFARYEPAFEAAIQRKQTGAPRVSVDVKGDPIGGFAFALDQGDLVTFGVEGGKISVSESLPEIWYISPSVIGEPGNELGGVAKDASAGKAAAPAQQILDAAYAAVSLFATRMKSDVVFPFLKALGDVRFIEQFSGCFGKQKYSDFMDGAKLAAFDAKLRFENGYDPKKVPRDDAFTVIELLNLLASDDDNKVLLDHESFKYSKIGRSRTDVSENLTDDELEKVREITAKIASERDARRIKALNDEIAAITSAKQAPLKFVADPAPDGYPISSLTFNEDRPNVSMLVRKTGKVDLTSRLPKDTKIPASFETFIFRNYAIIKDGLVNVEMLPVRLSHKTAYQLKAADLPEGTLGALDVKDRKEGDFLIDLRKLPIINRKMVKAVSAKDFFGTCLALTKAQAGQKVLNGYVKDMLPEKKSASFAILYGDDGATWLKEQGFTDYSGFSPKSVQAESTDVYMGKELKVSLKGLSSLPSLKEAKEKISKGKPNPPSVLMKAAIDEVEEFLASEVYTKAADQNAVLKAWLDGQQKAARTDARKLIYQVAQTTFCLVVGQVWFSEFKSLDENTLTVDGVECKVEMKEIEIKV
jgi:hypothetical protein